MKKLLSNKNCMLFESELGGHCDFMMQEKVEGTNVHKRFYSKLLVKYLNDHEEFDYIQK
jgi:predicted alpha/beta-fold hydrolase